MIRKNRVYVLTDKYFGWNFHTPEYINSAFVQLNIRTCQHLNDQRPKKVFLLSFVAARK